VAVLLKRLDRMAITSLALPRAETALAHISSPAIADFSN
jgi:hypothetical protein